MPTRYFSEYMLVKTQSGYIKIDKDGNKFPVDKKKSEKKVDKPPKKEV